MTSIKSQPGRQRILEVAERLFTEHGYQAVSIREIARACKVTNAALYYHFKNKEALFSEVLELHASHMAERMRKAAEPGATARLKVELILEEYDRLAADRRPLFFLLRRLPDKGHSRRSIEKQHTAFHNQFGRLINVMMQPLEDTLAQAVNQGELQPFPTGYSAASILVGMLHGHVQHRHTCCQADIQQEDIQTIVRLFWEGCEVK